MHGAESYHPPPLKRRWTRRRSRLLRVRTCNGCRAEEYWRRRRSEFLGFRLALIEKPIDHSGDAVLGAPAEPQHGQAHRSPAEFQGLIAIPQVQINGPAAHG